MNNGAESVIGLIKAELIRRQGPGHGSRQKFASLTRVDWFKTRRLCKPIVYAPPAECEAQFYAQALEGALVGQPYLNIEVDVTAAERLQDVFDSVDDAGHPK